MDPELPYRLKNVADYVEAHAKPIEIPPDAPLWADIRAAAEQLEQVEESK